MHSLDDTIVAIATAPGGAARGIVRISGAEALAIVECFFEPREAGAIAGLKVATRVPGLVRLTLVDGGERSLPCDLYLWPTKRSYTRQPVAELHTFGSPPLLEAIVRTACAAGARLAEPGEFTLRAFLAGRIDLVQAEAVLGVIDASDRRQLDIALAQLAGGLTRPLNSLRDQLLDLLADLEAGLDFAEEDIRFVARDELQRRLALATDTVSELCDQMRSREQTNAAPRVVLVGEPNAGKSSLFNALVGRSGAMVSPLPGTTRDYVSTRLELDGIACELIDTAGLGGNQDRDSVATMSQRMTREQLDQADLQLVCIDSSREASAPSPSPFARPELAEGTGEGQPAVSREPVERSNGGEGESLPVLMAQPQLLVLTKCDLAHQGARRPDGIATSSVTGVGIDALKAAIRRRLVATTAEAGPASVVAATAGRCRESLRLASDALTRARELAADRGGEELIAVELRAALAELGKIVGAIYTDDLLDRIFSRFCIGK
jgi:tRNA modification GTPase